MIVFRLIREGEAPAARATQDDMADAAIVGPARGAARLYRRQLLRTVAAETLAVHPDLIGIERLPHGGVAITQPLTLYASLSGRGGWTALAFGDIPVGVDVEVYPPDRDPPFDLLHPLEQEVILSDQNPRHLFLRFWTAREAYLKAQGRGLDVEPSAIRAAWRDGDVALIEEGRPVAFAKLAERGDAIAAIVELAPEA